MFTRCANCDTWFRIGPDAVRAAHGQVRCGFCGETFNALKTLCDSLPPDAFQQPEPDDRPPVEAAPTPEPVIVPDEREPASPPAAPDVPEDDIAPIRSDDAATPEDWAEPVTTLENPAGHSAYLDVDEPTPAAAADLDPIQPDEPADPPREAAYPPAYVAPEKRRGSGAKIAWTLGSIALFLALLTQITIYETPALRANNVTRPAIESLYAAFGHPLPPRRDLAALYVSRAKVTSAPGTGAALLVTASLTNRADFAQPYPMLEVSLTNRFGNPVGRGLFSAMNYLPHPADAATKLRAGETQSVRLEIADPGTEAVGFVIVPCVQTENGPQCAERPARD